MVLFRFFTGLGVQGFTSAAFVLLVLVLHGASPFRHLLVDDSRSKEATCAKIREEVTRKELGALRTHATGLKAKSCGLVTPGTRAFYSMSIGSGRCLRARVTA